MLLTNLRANSSTNNAILLKAKVIHRLVYSLFDFLPIAPALDELVHILRSR